MDGNKPNYNTINFIIMNATHFIEVWAGKTEGSAKNGLLHDMYKLENCLAKTAELQLRTIAIFKIKFK